jgi:AraC family transcriptional regulator of adaptative response/methylated-DNA-[protein]-cysteine methyltransferase
VIESGIALARTPNAISNCRFIRRWTHAPAGGVIVRMVRPKLTQREMAAARRRRDATYDGVFWVCVTSTGIFCKPSCRARTPHERNVRYALSVRDALARGYRPCKRCRPTETTGSHPDWVRAVLQLAQTQRDRRMCDQDLRSAGFDPVRVRRYFRAAFGMTFHAYHRAVRLGAALDDLKSGADPLAAGLNRGYASDSGFRSAFGRKFSATPGRSEHVRTITVCGMESPVGRLELGATQRGVCLVEFADRRALPTELATLEKTLGGPVVPGDAPLIEQMRAELAEYFAGRRREFTVPLDIVGTPFQREVWTALQEIPYGDTWSYGALAQHIGRPGGQRAVGQANGANRIAIVIPCHRVVQSNGKLRGYGGGLWRKQFLLDLECATLSGSEIPSAAHSAPQGSDFTAQAELF